LRQSIVFFLLLALFFSLGIFTLNAYGYSDALLKGVSEYTLTIVDNWNRYNFYHSLATPISDFLNSQLTYHVQPPFYYYVLSFLGFWGITPLVFSVFSALYSSFVVYLTISLLATKKPKQEFYPIGLLGSVLYLSSASIWIFKSFAFHPDVFTESLTVSLIYVYLKINKQEKYDKLKYFAALFILYFLFLYSSWLGILYGLVILVMLILQLRHNYRSVMMVFLVFVLTIFTPFLILNQYAQFKHYRQLYMHFFDNYYKYLIFQGDFLLTLKQIIWNNFMYLFGLYLFGLILFYYYIRLKKTRIIFSKYGYKYLLYYLLSFVLSSIFFYHYMATDYLTVYAIAPLCVINAIMFEKLSRYLTFRNKALAISLVILTQFIVLYFGLIGYKN
jgi:hypothetical protein